jgi:hypothetical protein
MKRETTMVKAGELESKILKSLAGLARHLAYLSQKVSALVTATAALKSHGRHIVVRGHSTTPSAAWLKLHHAASETSKHANSLAVGLELLRWITAHEDGIALPKQSPTTQPPRTANTPERRTPSKRS